LLLSHRIGGPAYHLRQYMKGLAGGRVKPSTVRLRRNDFFHDLADALNELQKAEGLLPSGQTREGQAGASDGGASD
jgi:hypothetical protein